jgi:hypothetical protein
MPLFGGLVVALFGQLFGFLAYIFAKEVAVKLAAVVAFGVFTLALFAGMRAAIVPLASSLFSTSYGSIIGLAFPPIAGTCMLAITAVWVGCALYSYQRNVMQAITA